jgi:4,5-DOPA dioxygenase extradiol
MTKTLDEILNPARPAGAYDDLLAEVLPAATAQRHWEPSDGALPALFVSHGAPPTLDDPRWLRDLFDWGQSLPKPRGIVIVSAHWENAPLAITNAQAGTPLYYDFGGFHPRYYTLQYRTPDATALARRVAGTIGDTTPVYEHRDRGLDHGAFIPLMAMYPAGDVPVVQVSMPSLDPQALLSLGQRLKSMREEGYLVIGSGFMTHSFATMRRPELMGYNREFDAWAADAVARRDVDALLDFQAKGPGAAIAHPTADHFVPLLLTLGAADDESQTPRSVIARETMWNSIRSIQAA